MKKHYTLLMAFFLICNPAKSNGLLKDTLRSDTLRNFYLEGIIKTAPHIDKLNNPQMGMTFLGHSDIKRIPTLLGEPDIIKAIHLQPGVSAGTEGFAGLFVRGGENDENMFLIDGSPIYQINHAGGLFSAYNVDAVSNVSFYKSSFPARYGGRLSSVTDISMKSGDFDSRHGHLTIGLTSVNAGFSGPLIKDKTALYIAVRRSWLELISMPALAILNASKKKSGEKMIAGYNFTDFNMKITQRLGKLGTLSFLSYYGHDRLKMGEHRFSNNTADNTSPYLHKDENRLGWGNFLASLKWYHPINTHWTFNMKASYTQYKSNFNQLVETTSGKKTDTDYEYSRFHTRTCNAIHDYSIDASVNFTPTDKIRIRTGAQYTNHAFSLENKTIESATLPSGNSVKEDDLAANEWNCYLEGDMQAFDWLRFNAGIRVSSFYVEGKKYSVPEPRLSVNFKFCRPVSLKIGYAKMSQFVQQISDNYISLPTDYWMPITRNNPPLISHQVSAGLYASVGKHYIFSIEGYYKKMNNLLEYKDDYKHLPAHSWEDKLACGKGRSYGVDMQAEADFDKVRGFVGYGLMWSDRLFAGLNQGRRFPAKYDNRHKITLSATWQLSKRVELSGGWFFMTGNRMTLSLENYSYPDGYPTDMVPAYPDKDEEMPNYYEGRNNVRLPAYHRLDLGVSIHRPLKHGRSGTWKVSLYNAYSRMNPIMIEKDNRKQTMGGQHLEPRFRQFSLFPVIPSVSYTYKF